MKRQDYPCNRQTGFTLTEVLVAIFVAIIFLAGILQFYIFTSQIVANDTLHQEASSIAKRNLRKFATRQSIDVILPTGTDLCLRKKDGASPGTQPFAFTLTNTTPIKAELVTPGLEGWDYQQVMYFYSEPGSCDSSNTVTAVSTVLYRPARATPHTPFKKVSYAIKSYYSAEPL